MSLMDDFNAGKLYGWYFCKVLIDNKNHVCPVFISKNENDFEIGEVLAPCDYNHFVELTQKVEQLKDKVEWEISKNKALEKQLTGAKEGIKKDRKALELMCDSNDELRALLKECAEYIEGDIEFRDDDDAMYCRDILTRINAAINGNERPDNG